jgi:hypothetical protein
MTASHTCGYVCVCSLWQACCLNGKSSCLPATILVDSDRQGCTLNQTRLNRKLSWHIAKHSDISIDAYFVRSLRREILLSDSCFNFFSVWNETAGHGQLRTHISSWACDMCQKVSIWISRRISLRIWMFFHVISVLPCVEDLSAKALQCADHTSNKSIALCENRFRIITGRESSSGRWTFQL